LRLEGHPREVPDEHARLVQIRDQLWLESLAPYARAYILRRRREDAEREERARALWQAERQAQRDGHDRAGGP
jgi:hypothetical protein